MYKRAAFKPPRFVNKPTSATKDTAPAVKSSDNPSPRDNPSERQDKVKDGDDVKERDLSQRKVQPPLKKRALHRVGHTQRSAPAHSQPTTSAESPSSTKRYLVQWRKRSTKKNKTWEGDGTLTVVFSGSSCTMVLKDNGKVMGKKSLTSYKPGFLDQLVSIGNYELEVDAEVTSEDKPQETIEKERETQYISPVVKRTSPEPQVSPEPDDTPVESSILMPSPRGDSEVKPVCIDPVLACKLRPHQIDGVKFLYECLLGLRSSGQYGCLLADEMGLGKTLMTITLIWTLYKQSPWVKSPQPPVKKVLICCPVTLIHNWKQEFKKWLGMNRIHILTLGGNSNSATIGDRQNLVSFGKLNVYQVLIINYEKVSAYHTELGQINFDLLVCDEGHRLKNKNNKVLNHLANLNIPRKLLLTGTPIQNDLVEFHTIINFINPGVLGDFKSFQKEFMAPILKSRDVQCYDPAVKKHGEKVSDELIALTKSFILRRTSAILQNYLTTRTDVVLYVPPTDLQVRLFRHLVKLDKFNQLLSDSTNHVFTLINLFKKICNSPALLNSDPFFGNLVKNDVEFTNAFSVNLTSSSGKINVLIPLLLEMINLDEKVVLISNYTQTLDLVELILNKLNLKFARLDGSTPKNTRTKLVAHFNKASTSELPIFLLSSKSGGMGINLVGASRLILFDNDWNPAVDLQSMARIHRDGQSKPCFIYRILTTGCIDEKIFQRQLMKNNLSSKFLDNDSDSKSDVFDSLDLKNLFQIDMTTKSNTHDLLECDCDGTGNNKSYVARSDDELTDIDEESESLRTSSFVSASELKKVEDENKSSATSIKHALHDYTHYDPVNLQSGSMKDKVLSNILSNKSFDDKTKLPISYIMMKVFQSE